MLTHPILVMSVVLSTKRGQEIGDNVDEHLACPVCESLNTVVIKLKKISRKDE